MIFSIIHLFIVSHSEKDSRSFFRESFLFDLFNQLPEKTAVFLLAGFLVQTKADLQVFSIEFFLCHGILKIQLIHGRYIAYIGAMAVNTAMIGRFIKITAAAGGIFPSRQLGNPAAQPAAQAAFNTGKFHRSSISLRKSAVSCCTV